MTDKLNQTFEEFFLAPRSRYVRGDQQIRINISRNTLIALVLSVIFHALVLLVILPKINFDNPPSSLATPIVVNLAPAKKAEVIPEKLPEPQENPKEIPEKLVKKNKTTKVITRNSDAESKPVFTVPDAMTTPKPSPEVLPPKEAKPSDVPTDMASYVKAQQAKRNALEADAARQNAEAAARELGPSQEQVRDERIKNNFKNGTNGIFEITSLSGRHAAFSFKGWTNDYSNARRESFEVEASTGQDVRLVMIRKMISLIRRHYDGDFNWESQRLHREIVKSARLEDSAELEEFMMMEFFGTNYKNTAY